jgi:dihydrolipoamide dehydrogenase
MEVREVEVAIIGAGTAGMSAYRRVREYTDSVVIIESSHYGTTCARVGCMPSKLLIAAAEANHQAHNAARFGVDVGSVTVDGKRVMQRVKSERDRFVGFVEETVNDWPVAHKVWGEARFCGPNELQVGEALCIKAERIVIAVGSRPNIPAPWYELGDRLLINDDVFAWDDLPSSVGVVGTGVIGLELSQTLSRLGVRTQLFGVGNRIGPLSDPLVNAQALTIFGEEMALSSDAAVEAVARTDDGVEVSYNEKGEKRTAKFEYLIAATGRRSNIDRLDLKAAGLAVNEQGLPAFDDSTGQIENSSVFIAGDVTNAHPLLHEAADDGRIAGDNAGTYPQIHARPRRAPISVVFTDPQIALVGARYAQLEHSDTAFAVGQVDFSGQGRSRVIGKNKGLLRVYGEHGSGLFLGAEMIGPAAEHLAHLLSWSVQHRLSVQQMLDSPFYHPVIEEGLRTAMRQLNSELKMGPLPVEGCLDCGPGA